MSARIAVLVSGTGSNLQALLDACDAGVITASVVGVASNKPGVRALDRAHAAGVAHVVVAPEPSEPRAVYDARLRDVVAMWQPDLVVLAGFMRLLSATFLDAFRGRVINVHPALPGELPGVGAIERAHAEARAGTRTQSGVMVHLVPDEGIDNGPVLGVVGVPVSANEPLEAFAARMHGAEHRLLIDTVARYVSDLVDMRAEQGAQP